MLLNVHYLVKNMKVEWEVKHSLVPVLTYTIPIPVMKVGVVVDGEAD